MADLSAVCVKLSFKLGDAGLYFKAGGRFQVLDTVMLATFTHLVGPRKGQCEKFESEKLTVGRAPDNGLRFDDTERRVSSHHAEIIRRGDTYVLRDLGSTNGTMINGRRVITSELEHDDLIEFGAGGPLVRFCIEQNGDHQPATGIHDRKTLPSLSLTDKPDRPSAVEKVVKRPARSRPANAMLIAGMAAAMLLGAVGGLLLSGRIHPTEAGEMSFAEVAERNSLAVVFIRADFEYRDASGQVVQSEAKSGSGFVVTPSGLIVTNRHVAQDWEYRAIAPGVTGRTTRIEVIFPGHKREDAIPAIIYRLSASKEIDVAILKINPPADVAVVHGFEPDLERIYQGDAVAVIGYPLGTSLLEQTNDERIDNSLSTGVVSRVGQDYIQLAMHAYHGNSGGPVLNRRGEVIGILTGNVGNVQDLALSTPVAPAFELFKDQLSHRANENR